MFWAKKEGNVKHALQHVFSYKSIITTLFQVPFSNAWHTKDVRPKLLPQSSMGLVSPLNCKRCANESRDGWSSDFWLVVFFLFGFFPFKVFVGWTYLWRFWVSFLFQVVFGIILFAFFVFFVFSFWCWFHCKVALVFVYFSWRGFSFQMVTTGRVFIQDQAAVVETSLICMSCKNDRKTKKKLTRNAPKIPLNLYSPTEWWTNSAPMGIWCNESEASTWNTTCETPFM